MVQSASRREFLRRASALSVLGSAAPWAMNLAVMVEAAAQGAADYKALVCVFLHGGNDHGNTLIPYDSAGHALYASLRDTLARSRESLSATMLSPLNPIPGCELALGPGLAPLLPVFDAERLAVLLNIGPLMQPTTKALYSARSVPLPRKLMSHNDQQSTWQSFASEGAPSGWGGRMGDLFASANGNATFTSISVARNAAFLSGSATAQYQISPSGSTAIRGLGSSLFGSPAAAQALRSIITTHPADDNLHRYEHVRMVTRSIDADLQLQAALSGFGTLSTEFPATPLAGQFKMVARLIAARAGLGSKRQVFFVSLGGFDFHDFLMDKHQALLGQVAGGMAAFDAALTELGVQQQVTTFTASDFGRTLTSNGDGSDHGWGAHHLVMGGAAKGRRLVGTMPVLANNGPDDVGQGRLLPTTSVDQLAGTLATWFGVGAGDMPWVVPNLSAYSVRNLGLLA